MKILYAASEVFPFCKTGGLADVAGSLPAALARQGAQTAVVLPLYQSVRERFGGELSYLCYDYVNLSWRRNYCGLFRLIRDGVTYYFLDNEQYFARPNLYGYADDGERFAFFSRAVVQMLPHMAFWPEVIHCNDWQTACIPIYLKDDGVREARYRSIRTVLTIHNIEYQGRFSQDTLGDLFGLAPGWIGDGTLLMDGDVNLLKGAILCADAVTAVSPTYACELKYAFFAHGLESILQKCAYKLSGVLNGIDVERYDPSRDPGIPALYSAADLAGKQADKAALQTLLGLSQEADTPIIGVVSRLVSHKGLDLIREAFHSIMELPVQMVVLGKGDAAYHSFFSWASSQYPGRVAVRLDYDDSLAMSIYAGADLFLMPSKSEPCGLSQMIAMRYGTVPIVRETGGLRDTVSPFDPLQDSGCGFAFANYHAGDMLFVIRQAVALYRENRAQFDRLRRRCMAQDFSWGRSADAYLQIYGKLTGKPLRLSGKPAQAQLRGRSEQTKLTGRPEQAQLSGKSEPERLTGRPAQAQLSGKSELERLTGRPAQAQLTGKPEQERLAGKPAQAQLSGKSELEKLTGRPEQAQLTGKPELEKLTGRPAQERLSTPPEKIAEKGTGDTECT